jgi:hypothetical protein
MPKVGFPQKLAFPLGTVSNQSQLISGIGSVWSIGLDGVGYLLSNLGEENPFEFRSLEYASVPLIKPRVDQSEEPGEQTLEPWWARGQHSWHEGGGQDVLDSPFSSRFKFRRSYGLDIFTKGQLSQITVPDFVPVNTTAAASDHWLVPTGVGLFIGNSGAVRKFPPGGGASTSHSIGGPANGTPVRNMTTDGEFLYVCWSAGSSGIRRIPIIAFTGDTLVNDQEPDIIEWVKGRLMGARANKLYEYDLSVTTEPDPFFTERSTLWKFTAITEAGPAIYFSGYVDDRSEILASRLTAQDIPYLDNATVGAVRSVWTAPRGEIIHSIKGFLAKALLVGTNRGLRLATISTGEGDLEVSPLICETKTPIRAIDTHLDYGYFAWEDFEGSSGLGKINLGDLGYSTWTMVEDQPGLVRDVALWNGVPYFWIDASTLQLVYGQTSLVLMNGWFETGEFRYGTLEQKALRFIDLNSKGGGSLDVAIAVNQGAFVDYATNVEPGWAEEPLRLKGSRFEVRISFNHEFDNQELGPVLLEWRIRAEPTAEGRFRYWVPLLMYDYMVNLANQRIGRSGYADDLRRGLEEIYREDREVIFQFPARRLDRFPQEKEVRIEEMRFKNYTAPKGCEGPGGVCLLVLRDIH